MPQTIDVTGLPPEAVRAVEVLVGMLREKVTSAGGTQPAGGEPYPLRGTVVQYDRPFESAIVVDAPPASGDVPPSQMPYEEWVKWFRAWVDSHQKRDIVIDDSRESIYEGRGE